MLGKQCRKADRSNRRRGRTRAEEERIAKLRELPPDEDQWAFFFFFPFYCPPFAVWRVGRKRRRV
ncbi:hypothetical protein GQ53DRAFT_740143 [Thozetella sp. PMI_491]|nr:hypothetical protein GQ53DRAFT_740143 [Thozetella sp. PMI_491]